MVEPGFPTIPAAAAGMGRAPDRDHPHGVDPVDAEQRDVDGEPVGSSERDADIYGIREEDDRQGINTEALEEYLTHRDAPDR